VLAVGWHSTVARASTGTWHHLAQLLAYDTQAQRCLLVAHALLRWPLRPERVRVLTACLALQLLSLPRGPGAQQHAERGGGQE
jgi:hypothetical protein